MRLLNEICLFYVEVRTVQGDFWCAYFDLDHGPTQTELLWALQACGTEMLVEAEPDDDAAYQAMRRKLVRLQRVIRFADTPADAEICVPWAVRCDEVLIGSIRFDGRRIFCQPGIAESASRGPGGYSHDF